MKYRSTIRDLGLATGLALATVQGGRAQMFAATAPTLGVAATSDSAPTADPIPPRAARQVLPAKIALVDGRLAVTADNSSLNQILYDISKLNGMQITGGVPDERVFGVYGPKAPSAVLNELLEGTKANVLVRENAEHNVVELVLTARTGGATPPPPTQGTPAAGDPGDDANVPPQPGERRRGMPPTQAAPEGMPLANPGSEPANPGQGTPEPPNTEPPNTDPATPDQPQEPPATDTTDQSPNGVKTPQEIYDQLMKMQQPQQNPDSTPDQPQTTPEPAPEQQQLPPQPPEPAPEQ